MRGNLVGNHTLPNSYGSGQPEVLLRRNVAKHVRAEPADHRRTYSARNMVVARRDISDEWTEGVERRFVADLFHATDVHFDLVHRDVARALDHHLHVTLPRAASELSEGIQLGELRAVAGVGDTTRAQAIA